MRSWVERECDGRGGPVAAEGFREGDEGQMFGEVGTDEFGFGHEHIVIEGE